MPIRFREIFAKAGTDLSVRFELHLGLGLIDLAVNQGALDRIVQLRAALLLDGFELPGLRVRDRMSLEPFEYEIESEGTIIAPGESPQFDEVLQDLSEIVRTHAILSAGIA